MMNAIMYFSDTISEKEMLYGKDAVCPPKWHEWLVQSDLSHMFRPGGSKHVLHLLPDTVREPFFYHIKSQ